MKLENRDKPLFYISLGIVALLAVVVLLRQPLFARPWVDPACGNRSLECLFYTWQTLISGLLAVLAAFFAARYAWLAAMKQIETTAAIPFEMRRNELVWERLRLEQICQRIDMYKEAASEFVALFERTSVLRPNEFRGQFLMTEPISRPTGSILGSMAETCQMPGLRAELLNAQRNVNAFNETAEEMVKLCRGTRRWEEETGDKVDAARRNVNANAKAVVVSIEAVVDAIGHDLQLIEVEDNRLAENRIGD